MRITSTLAVSSLFAFCFTTIGAPADPLGLVQEGTASTVPATTAQASKPTYAVVAKGRNVNVRTAASVEGGYPFFQVHEGNLVQVLYERFGWSRIRTSTPAFAKAYGYVSANAVNVDGANGTRGTVTMRTTLSAPNLMQESRPDASWEGLDPPLAVGTMLTLIEKIPGNEQGEPAKWKVRLPQTQEGWINSVWLRKATEQEIAAAMPKSTTTTADGSRTAQASTGSTTETTNSASEGTSTEATTLVAVDPQETTTTDGPGTTTEETEEIQLTPEEERAAKLAALDTAFRTMLRERIESAELELLQQQFMQFAQREDATDLEKETAEARGEVLALKIEVQDQLKRLKQMREQTQIDNENISATRLAMDARAPYDVVGTLNASIVFSGNGTMPLLFRLQDPSGGQTIAYLMPDDRYDIAAMTGLLVGIVGTSRYDETLQLHLVQPRRIDLLGPQKRTGPPTSTDPTTVTPDAPTVAEADAGATGDE